MSGAPAQTPASMDDVLASIGRELKDSGVDIEVLRAQAIGTKPIDAARGFIQLAEKFGEDPALMLMEFLRNLQIDTTAQEAELISKMPPETAKLMSAVPTMSIGSLQGSVQAALGETFSILRKELEKAGIGAGEIDGILNELKQTASLGGQAPQAAGAANAGPVAQAVPAAPPPSVEGLKAQVVADKAQAEKMFKDEMVKNDLEPDPVLEDLKKDPGAEPSKPQQKTAEQLKQEMEQAKEQSWKAAQEEMKKNDLDLSEIKGFFGK